MSTFFLCVEHVYKNIIANVSNWMSSNFLFLNPSKTEFLIFGLPQQFSKLNNPKIHLPNNIILSPVDIVRNLGVIMSYFSFLPSHFISMEQMLMSASDRF